MLFHIQPQCHQQFGWHCGCVVQMILLYAIPGNGAYIQIMMVN